MLRGLHACVLDTYTFQYEHCVSAMMTGCAAGCVCYDPWPYALQQNNLDIAASKMADCTSTEKCLPQNWQRSAGSMDPNPMHSNK